MNFCFHITLQFVLIYYKISFVETRVRFGYKSSRIVADLKYVGVLYSSSFNCTSKELRLNKIIF